MPPPRKQKGRYNSARYDGPHRTMRRRLDPVVQTGTVPCVRCGELIEPDTSGTSTTATTAAAGSGRLTRDAIARAGWEAMVRSQNGNGHRIDPEEQPYKWSQRWSEDPPPGTTVNVRQRLRRDLPRKRGLADDQPAQRRLLAAPRGGG